MHSKILPSLASSGSSLSVRHRTSSPPPLRTNFIGSLAILALVCAGSLAAQGLPHPPSTPPPTPTKTRTPPPPILVFPNPVGGQPSTGSFESGVAAGQTQLPLPTTFGSWVFTQGSGQAGIVGVGAMSMAAAPAGTAAAYLSGTCSVEHPLQAVAGVPLDPGTYRMRCKAAQKRVNTPPPQVVSLQSLRVDLVFPGNVETMARTTLPESRLSGSNDAVFIEVVTRPFRIDAGSGPSVPTHVRFSGESTSIADTVVIDHVRIEPVHEWDHYKTWVPIGAPTTSDIVLIDAPVAIRETGAVAASVEIAGGELLVANRNSGLTTGWLYVRAAGLFEVGQEEAPFLHDFHLLLTRPSAAGNTENIDGMGTKFLGAMDEGRIEMHGRPVTSWTRLAVEARETANEITVRGAPKNWNVDDEIVIAGTNSHEIGSTYQDQAENANIDAITFDPGTGDTTLTLSRNVDYRHFGHALKEPAQIHDRASSYPTNSFYLEQSAEVGLLTRNVRVTGDSVNNFGGHVMIMHCQSCCGEGGRGRFSHVEFFRMGQELRLGRYPLHWHMLMDQGDGQYAKGCSVHRSWNRAVTIHGTDSVVVENTVAYDHLGHGYFLEDASERFNVLRGNLAILTRRPSQGLLPSDTDPVMLQNHAPASFWITNPNNTIEDNVAAGTPGTGFWLIFPSRILGLSYGAFPSNHPMQLVPPYRQPLGSFDRNLAHTCFSAFDINDGIEPVGNSVFDKDEVIPNFGWEPETLTTPSAPAPGTFREFTAWGCPVGIYAGTSFDTSLRYFVTDGTSETVTFTGSIVADCDRQLQLADYVAIEDSMFLADSGNSLRSTDGSPRCVSLYDGSFRLAGCHFVNFHVWPTFIIQPQGAATLHANSSSMDGTHAPGPLPHFAGVDYTAVSGHPEQWGWTVVDDGTLSGVQGTLTSNHPMMLVAPGVLETALPGNGLMYSSPHKFALISVRYDEVTRAFLDAPLLQVPPQPALPLPGFLISRTGGSNPSFLNNLNTNIRHHRQFTAIVDTQSSAPGLVYTLQWPASDPPYGGTASNHYLTITMDDVQYRDVFRVDVDLGFVPSPSTFGVEDVTLCTTAPSSPLPVPVPSVSPTDPQWTNGGSVIYYHASNSTVVQLRLCSPGSQQTIKINW